MKNKISLAGDLGSGKSTVSAILVDRLGLTYYSTGRIVRDLAAKHGMSVSDFNVWMETHPEIDHEIDDGLVRLAENDAALIIDSRMAWHFTKGTLRVYLSTDMETSALRIMDANRAGEHAATLEETVAETRARRASEKKRYAEQYGVDIKDLSNYDLVVDTTYASPEEVADVLETAYAAWQEADVAPRAVLCPERLYYPDREADGETVTAYAAALERGEQLPPVTVTEKDGDFYLVDGLESAMAYAFHMATFLPATLVRAEVCGEYVQMKNSL